MVYRKSYISCFFVIYKEGITVSCAKFKFRNNAAKEWIMSPPNLNVETLTPNVTVFGDGAIGR